MSFASSSAAHPRLRVLGLQCMRCSARYPVSHYAGDCPACRSTARTNLSAFYADEDVPPKRPVGRSMWRWDARLPVASAEAISLGEGDTPLQPLSSVARTFGVRAVYAKDESRNPTWSFKDRLASAAVSSARALGAKVIASSSSGNAGAAVAAYAARAGMPCVVFTFQGTSGPMVTQMRAYGAMVLSVREKRLRWTLLEQGITQLGWFPTSPFFGPPVGSNPLGVEGYKTLAYEIAEQLGWDVPEWCVLPVCYGDALIGMWHGFNEMKGWGWIERVPRMVAAEVYGSLGRALADDLPAPPAMPRSHDTAAISIGAQQGTVQSLLVLRRSGGTAVSVENGAMLKWQQQLASTEGLYGEPAAVAPFCALEVLKRDGVLKRDDRVVVLFTASGLKDPAATDRALGECPVVGGDFPSVLRILETQYDFKTS